MEKRRSDLGACFQAQRQRYRACEAGVNLKMPWFKVYYRNRSYALAHGEQERDQLMSKKVPKGIHFEEAAEYECETCKTVSGWPFSAGAWSDINDTWRWYGRYHDLDADEPVRVFCSRKCEPVNLDRTGRFRPEGVNWDEYPAIFPYEPVRQDNWRVLRDAQNAANPRHFPFPEWPAERFGVGWCRWCGDEIVESKGKREGQQSLRRTWHRKVHGDPRDCYKEFLLHTDMPVQRAYLEERDGPGCGICGSKQGGLEVDHIMPLWRRHEFEEIADQRAMFGPENLWLLCNEHHKRKTSIEAKERAEERRDGQSEH